MSPRAQVSASGTEDDKRTVRSYAESADLLLSEEIVKAYRERIDREAMVNETQCYRVENRVPNPLLMGDLTGLDVDEALIQSSDGWWIAPLVEPDLSVQNRDREVSHGSPTTGD